MTPSSLAEIQTELRKRNPETRILAVSKFQPVLKIRELHSQGQWDFGENYVQEALEKQAELSDLNLRWHFIGHLQKNKVKLVVGKFALIHSVDSLSLLESINRKASELGIQQKVLLQLNLAMEETKGGFSEEEFRKALPEMQKLKAVELSGLMTMPPLFDNPEEARPFFQRISNIRNQLSSQLPTLRELSMGTSSDYLIAAEEGATLVRLGTILFGERPQK